MFSVRKRLFILARWAHFTPVRRGVVPRETPKKESSMNSLQSKCTPLGGFAVSAAAALLTGLLAGGPAAAQSAGPAAAATIPASQNATTSREAVSHDPFSPFVYDVLGATPSIRLPASSGRQALARAAATDKASSSDRAAKGAEATPTVAVTAERAGTAARAP
jgi:hypothetical protein